MSVIVWKMNGDVFTTSFQNAILLKKFVKTQIATSRSSIMLLCKSRKGMLILLEFVKL